MFDLRYSFPHPHSDNKDKIGQLESVTLKCRTYFLGFAQIWSYSCKFRQDNSNMRLRVGIFIINRGGCDIPGSHGNAVLLRLLRPSRWQRVQFWERSFWVNKDNVRKSVEKCVVQNKASRTWKTTVWTIRTSLDLFLYIYSVGLKLSSNRKRCSRWFVWAWHHLAPTVAFRSGIVGVAARQPAVIAVT